MIEVRGLTKRFGDLVAVDDLTFEVRPGVVTGFLGPNGAGKSTTMRMILGSDDPTSGEALIDGRRYRTFSQPLHHVGALIESDALHPSRSARRHRHRPAGRPGGAALRRAGDGLDADGVRWVRHLVRGRAAEGRTVLVSSHLVALRTSTRVGCARPARARDGHPPRP